MVHAPCLSASSGVQVGAFKLASGENLPVSAVASGSVWQNSDGQLAVLQHAIAAPPEVFTFAQAERKQAPVPGMAECVPQTSCGTRRRSCL